MGPRGCGLDCVALNAHDKKQNDTITCFRERAFPQDAHAERCHLGSLLGGCHVLFMPRGGLDIAACFHSGKRRVRQDFVNEGFSKRLDAASVKTMSVMTKSNGEGASEPFE